jgi:hypothetical protein
MEKPVTGRNQPTDHIAPLLMRPASPKIPLDNPKFGHHSASPAIHVESGFNASLKWTMSARIPALNAPCVPLNPKNAAGVLLAIWDAVATSTAIIATAFCNAWVMFKSDPAKVPSGA